MRPQQGRQGVITLDNAPTSSGAAVSEQDARNLLQRFQFPTKRWFDRVGVLSGGERRRLQLLQILAKRPNVLIFDEPSNDLDLATLASLEDYLTDTFDGSLVVVSHDEFFMNKVTDHLLVFQGKGEVGDFQGSYSDFLVYRKETAAEGARAARAAAAAAASGIVPTGTVSADAHAVHHVCADLTELFTPHTHSPPPSLGNAEHNAKAESL